MPIFDIEANGKQYEVEAPDAATAAAAFTQSAGGFPKAADQFDQMADASLADVGKSAATGIAKGGIGLAGLLGDLPEALARGTNYIGNAIGGAFGLEPNKLPDRSQTLNRYVPGSRDIQSAIESRTGPFYKPQSTAGQYAQTIGEFAPAVLGGPGSLATRAATRAVIPGMASEAAGQLTAGSDFEGAARMGGALLGATLPGMAGRVVTPNPMRGPRADAVNILRNEGVEVPASMATGNKLLKAAESELGGPRFDDAILRMNEQYTAAALRRVGVNANRATPDVINAAEDRIGNVFNTVAARNPHIPLDARARTDITRIGDDFNDLTGGRNPLIDRYTQQIFNTGQRPAISGQSYQTLQSDIARMARAAQQPELRMALQDMRAALDAAVQRGLRNPADIAAWRQARRDWANMIVINRAVSTSTEAAANGFILPAKLQNAMESMRRGTYSHGRGDFAELARAGNQIMKQFQDSGTPARARAMAIPATIGAVAGAGLGALPGAALGMLAPSAAGRALMSRPAQAYLQNQRAAGFLNNVGTGRNAATQLGLGASRLLGGY